MKTNTTAIFLIILIILFLGAGVGGYYIAKSHFEEPLIELIVVKDTEIIAVKGELHKANTLANIFEQKIDSILANPNIEIQERIIRIPYSVAGETDTIWRDSIIKVPVFIFAKDILDYTDGKALTVDNIVSDKGDSIAFQIWMKIFLDILADKKGNIYVEDSVEYQIKNINFYKHKDIIYKRDKFQLYAGLQFTLWDNFATENMFVPLFGVETIFGERLKISLYANRNECKLGGAYKLFKVR